MVVVFKQSVRLESMAGKVVGWIVEPVTWVLHLPGLLCYLGLAGKNRLSFLSDSGAKAPLEPGSPTANPYAPGTLVVAKSFRILYRPLPFTQSINNPPTMAMFFINRIEAMRRSGPGGSTQKSYWIKVVGTQ